MVRFDKHLWRAAAQVHQFLLDRIDRQPPPLPSRGMFEQLHEATDRLRKVTQRGWELAKQSLTRELYNLQVVADSHYQQAFRILQENLNPAPIPPQREIYLELLALQTEFETLDVELRRGRLSVVTDPVEFNGVDLGAFRIVLDWRTWSSPSSQLPYCVQAIDPVTPEHRNSITHPHVMHDHLCEGDAAVPLRAALFTGRLTDFFQIINQVLHTYNEASPYAPIDEWTESVCPECGGHSSDGLNQCQTCHAQMCDGCCSCCEMCEVSTCTSCMQVCAICFSDVCDNCVELCEGCGKSFCSACFPPVNRCQECQNGSKTGTAEPDHSAETTDPDPDDLALLTLVLGEAAVSP